MADELAVSRAHPVGERPAADLEPLPDQLTVDSFAGKIAVQWAPEAAVTPLGQLPFFIDFLKQSGLFEQLVREAPLSYTSPNAPTPRDVLGTLVLSMVAGGRRYAHVNALRYDGVNPELYEMGTTRLVLEAEVVAGKQHHRQYGSPVLERLLERPAEAERPALVRGGTAATGPSA